MNSQYTRIIATTAMAAVMCTTTPSCSSMDDDTLTQAQAQTIGTVGGAAIGGGLGLLLSSGSDDSGTKALATAGGALIGGAIGWYAGKCWGDSIVKAKKNYRSDEEYALANLEQVRTRISDAEKTNNTLRKEIAAAQKAGKIDKQRLATIQQNVKTRKDKINKDIQVARSSMSGASTETNEQLRQEIAQLEAQSREISANLSKLQQYT